jgi:hypothetical protein
MTTQSLLQQIKVAIEGDPEEANRLKKELSQRLAADRVEPKIRELILQNHGEG